MIDAYGPFADTLAERVGGGTELAAAWREATEVCEAAARATADLRPLIGRARPLAERSVGTPDAGATSLALCARAVSGVLSLATESHDTKELGVMPDKWRIIVGCDDAGLEYKNVLKADLENDDRVEKVVDIGVGAEDTTPYPHIAVMAARMVAAA